MYEQSKKIHEIITIIETKGLAGLGKEHTANNVFIALMNIILQATANTNNLEDLERVKGMFNEMCDIAKTEMVNAAYETNLEESGYAVMD